MGSIFWIFVILFLFYRFIKSPNMKDTGLYNSRAKAKPKTSGYYPSKCYIPDGAKAMVLKQQQGK
jgi:hypothetical protein